MAITTIYTYPLNGTQRDFNIPFEYLARRFVVLTLIGTDRRELELTADFRFVTQTVVSTNVAWGPADGYERLEIRRSTSATDRLVDFADGSILRASELNISQIQTLHVAEEARNMVADTISTNNDGDLDARGRRLVNLADAIDPGDAVTLRQEMAWSAGALNSKNAAKISETNAKASETAAKQSETKAKVSEDAAKLAQTGAQTSETKAALSETKAQTSADNAKASELAAAQSQSQAMQSQSAAEQAEQNAAGWAAGVNMPNAAGQAGRILRQNVEGTGLEYGPLVQDTPGDQTAGVLLLSGAFGQGSRSLATGALTNINTLELATGDYGVAGNATGSPLGATPGVLEVKRWSDSVSKQTIRAVNGAGATYLEYTRQVRVGPVFDPWVEIPNAGSDSGWIAPSRVNSWAHGGLADARYRKVNGWVSMRGCLDNSSNSRNNTVAFTLPSGFRPPVTLAFRTAGGVYLSGSGLVRIDPNGAVTLVDVGATSSPIVGLDGVGFYTD